MYNHEVKYNKNIIIVPTVLDNSKYSFKEKLIARDKEPYFRLYWNTNYRKAIFYIVINSIKILFNEYDIILKIIGGSRDFFIPGVGIENKKWLFLLILARRP